MIVKSNQIIAKEGILSYNDHGKVLKPWSELSKFIGKEVPVRKNHDGDEVGKAIIKKCPLGKNLLCADIRISDSESIYKGYSIGTISLLEDSKGKLGLEEYDKIQRIIDIDHIALTEAPRDPNALSDAIPTDVFIKENKNNYITIYDSFQFMEEKEMDEKSPIKKDEFNQKVILDELYEKITNLTKENAKLKEMVDSFEKTERQRLISEIKKKAPKAELPENIALSYLQFGLKLIDSIEPYQTQSEPIQTKPLETLIKKIKGDNFNINDLYRQKGGL